MNAQKATLIEIKQTPGTNKFAYYAVTAFIGLGYLLYGGRTHNTSILYLTDNNYFTYFVMACFAALAVLALYFRAMRLPYNEIGYMIVYETEIDITGKSPETITRAEMVDIKLNTLKSDTGELGNLDLAQLSFAYRNKNYSYQVLFDRKQRLDEFYSRFSQNTEAKNA